ncbi:MAG TPA: type II toxin-antitoxin system RelE/ParE family toxin [Usitatibacter sp.]|nr:type II toxin-antitoxin system RelE/ParE family toxin [Usitatibacter sp.]
MSKPKLAIRFFRSAQGREPVRDWLKGLSDEQRKAIGDDIRTVQFGWPLGMPLVEKLEPGLWEVRVDLPSGIARVLFTIHQDEAVLLHGFVKKSQKIPKDDLETARRRRRQI